MIPILMLCNLLLACSSSNEYTPDTDTEDQVSPEITSEQAIALTAGAVATYEVDNENPTITIYGKNSIFGVCMKSVATGHFMAKATANVGENFGLALVKAKNGRPDYNNYTSVSVCNESGILLARVIDRQEGVDSVLDNTGEISSDSDKEFRYTVALNGNYFSVPFTSANGKVQIMRNDISGFFHFYIGVSKVINGVEYENWIELAQSKDWNDSSTEFFVCPIARTTTNSSATVEFQQVSIENIPESDIEDNSFGVVHRDYTWAGFQGDAAVVSFDPKYNSATSQGRKFVFWSEMNYVPAWHLSNEMLYCYEFAETWADNINGCFEPMSDRLLAYSKINIEEDNSVRKVVKWEYTLINPDYKAPYSSGEAPDVVEYYTFYPDGVGVRRIEYIQKSNDKYRYHELSEPMVIAGSSSIPSDHIKEPAMTVTNLSGGKFEIHPAKPDNLVSTVQEWSEQIYCARLNSAPDPFCVFSYTEQREEVSPLPICNDFSWHAATYQMSHWPVDKQKYLRVPWDDYDKSYATWPSQVSHSSLIGIEAKGDTSWSNCYQTTDDGYKYRVYLMLLGVVTDDDIQSVDGFTRSWLYGQITNLQGATLDSDVGYSQRELGLEATATQISFNYKVDGEAINPVFRIDSWMGGQQVEITLDGQGLSANSDYVASIIEGSMVIWFNRTFNSVDTNAITLN